MRADVKLRCEVELPTVRIIMPLHNTPETNTLKPTDRFLLYFNVTVRLKHYVQNVNLTNGVATANSPRAILEWNRHCLLQPLWKHSSITKYFLVNLTEYYFLCSLLKAEPTLERHTFIIYLSLHGSLTDSCWGFDVHGSVHRKINLIQRSNKMQPCSRIYYSNVS